MKRVTITLLCFIYLMLFSQWAIAGEQTVGELRNSGFEDAEEGKPKYWKLFGPEDSLLLDDGVFFEGSHSIRISLKQPSMNVVHLEQEIEVEAAKRYDFGGIIRVDLDDGFAKIMVVFLDEKKDEIDTFTLPRLSHNRNWVYQSMWIKSPNGSDVARIICVVKGSGKAWFDDVHFTAKLRGGY